MLCCAQVAGEVISAVGSDSVQWLDDGSEHPHRIALSVQSSRVPDVCHRLTEGTHSRGVQVTLNPGIPASRLCSLLQNSTPTQRLLARFQTQRSTMCFTQVLALQLQDDVLHAA